MQRPSATAALLVATAGSRAVAIGLATQGTALEPVSLVLLVDVLVPTGIATADLRGRPAAPTAAVAHGALGAATLMADGLGAIGVGLPATAALVASLVASALAMLAGATAIGRWQDHGAPSAGPGPRWIRAVALAAATVVALLLVTHDVALIGAVAFEVGVLPAPVGVATTVSLQRLPLLLGALLPMAWAVTRVAARHLRAVALVLGARAAVEAVVDALLLPLGSPLWPPITGAVAALVLLVVVPRWAQATSSRA